MDNVTTQPSALSTTSTSLLDRLRTRYNQGLVIVKQRSTNKGAMSFWFKGLSIILKDIYGPSSALVTSLEEKARVVIKTGISQEFFASEVISLKGLIDGLEYTAGTDTLNAVSTPSIPPAGKNVFIIHGHDEVNTLRLSHILQNELKLNPIIIMAKPGMSRSIIDKFEDSASSCAFAFALVTPDDVITSPTGSYHQGRPNVIFELGWFVGRLGKHQAAILLKDGASIHSDIDGVSRIQFRDNISERFLEIQKELQACGMI